MHRIDVHHHLLPQQWVAEVKDHKVGGWAPQTLDWTPERSLENMDRHGFAVAIVSIGLPGVWWGDVAAARRLARWLNEYAAQLVRDHPERFGFFATLPMPDVEGSLTELTYALDVLRADGIGMLTSYGDRWPGDPAFAPLFDELNRRRAVTYFHPTCPGCLQGALPDVPVSTVEYVFDTTRAVTNLLCTGTLARCPDVRWIFSHGGGTIPFVADRIEHVTGERRGLRGRMPHGAAYELRRLHFELTSATSAPTLAAVRAFMPVKQLLLGSDFPYIPTAPTLEGLQAANLPQHELRGIESENALELFPRLRKLAALAP